ncbi:MAG: NAD(P)/FAD-dependent oxidoreductase [bacterium]
MDETTITIIGAGVIGLAVAAELSKAYDDIFVIEKNDGFGQETSSRNSEVIHAGIYYPRDSLKFRLCREGLHHLYETCESASIPYRRVGKIIIATDDSELDHLEHLFQNGASNGLTELRLLDRKGIHQLEPNTNAIAGIHSPLTGIVDSHALMKHLYHVAQDGGADIAYQSEVNFLTQEGEHFIVGIQQDDYRFKSRVVINAAGLWSDSIASLLGIDVDECGYRLHFCKGDYFAYGKPSPVSMLVYPLPDEYCTALGIHATLDLGSRLRFGPDDEYVNAIDYRVDPSKGDGFYRAASRIIPGIEREAIVPDMAGIRPKIQGPGDTFRDFLIRNEAGYGLNGFINLIGIESPGLTACLSIARMVKTMIAEIME